MNRLQNDHDRMAAILARDKEEMETEKRKAREEREAAEKRERAEEEARENRMARVERTEARDLSVERQAALRRSFEETRARQQSEWREADENMAEEDIVIWENSPRIDPEIIRLQNDVNAWEAVANKDSIARQRLERQLETEKRITKALGEKLEECDQRMRNLEYWIRAKDEKIEQLENELYPDRKDPVEADIRAGIREKKEREAEERKLAKGNISRAEMEDLVLLNMTIYQSSRKFLNKYSGGHPDAGLNRNNT